MNIELFGTGRAAGALGMAFSRAGHVVTDVHGRSAEKVTAGITKSLKKREET